MYKQFILFLLLVATLIGRAQTPTATITSVSSTICSGRPVTFTTSTSNSPTSFSWSVSPASGAVINLGTTNDFCSITFTNSGVFVITLNVANSTTNSVSSLTVSVNKSALAAFNASLVTAGFPNQLVLTNYSKSFTSTKWLYSDDSNADLNFNTVKNYTLSGSYSTTLVALANFGCNDSLVYRLRLEDSSGIRLPNIFTPNDDGANDVYKPIAKGMKELNFKIFNRYGTIIFEGDKRNSFWDGYTTSGLPCSAGVYFCICNAVGFDGKTYELKANVTLVR